MTTSISINSMAQVSMEFWRDAVANETPMRIASIVPKRPQMSSGHYRMATIVRSTHSTMHYYYYHTMTMYSGTATNFVDVAFGNCSANGSTATHTIYSRITTSIFVNAPKN